MSVIMITGASSGIGRAAARSLALDGHVVVAAARRVDRLDELAAEVRDHASPEQNGKILPVELDVTDKSSIERAMARVDELEPGGVDVLINNAGFSLIGPVETLPSEAIRRQFETNVLGLIEMSRAVLPAMRARRSGRIVNISSVLGRMSFVGTGVYSSSKFAVESISDALRMETAPFGIRVVIVEPGFANTDIDTRPRQDSGIADYRDLVGAVAREGENGTSPEQVARTVIKAAVTLRPRTRYVVPARFAGVIGLLSALPTGVSDRLKLAQV